MPIRSSWAFSCAWSCLAFRLASESLLPILEEELGARPARPEIRPCRGSNCSSVVITQSCALCSNANTVARYGSRDTFGDACSILATDGMRSPAGSGPPDDGPPSRLTFELIVAQQGQLPGDRSDAA